MIAYAEPTPPPFAGLSPATEYALLAIGAAFCVADFDALFAAGLAAPVLVFFAGARGADGFFGVAPFVAEAVGFWVGTAILSNSLVRQYEWKYAMQEQLKVSRASLDFSKPRTTRSRCCPTHQWHRI